MFKGSYYFLTVPPHSAMWFSRGSWYQFVHGHAASWEPRFTKLERGCPKAAGGNNFPVNSSPARIWMNGLGLKGILFRKEAQVSFAG